MKILLNFWKKQFYVDPKLIGIWKSGRKTLEIMENGHVYSGTVMNKYAISADGKSLIIGNVSKYLRQSTETSGLAGSWLSENGEESIVYREDGFYHCVFSNEKMAYFGKWSASETHFDSAEFTAIINSHNDYAYSRSYLSKSYRFKYSIKANKLTVTQNDGSKVEYEKAG
jgi:hypothetical protein